MTSEKKNVYKLFNLPWQRLPARAAWPDCKRRAFP